MLLMIGIKRNLMCNTESISYEKKHTITTFNVVRTLKDHLKKVEQMGKDKFLCKLYTE